MKKIKMVVFGIHRPSRAPNERFRWFQFEAHLMQHHAEVRYLYLINENEDKILFHSRNILLKIWVYFKTFFKRHSQVLNLECCDVILIYRELHWFNFLTKQWFRILRKKSSRIVYDFDDALWLKSPFFLENLIKKPFSKTTAHIRQSHRVIAGNSFLYQFALRFNPHSTLIPTVVDTDYYKPLHLPSHNPPDHPVTIGWLGSHSTIPHLMLYLPVLTQLKKKLPNIQFRFVAKKFFLHELNVWIDDWQKENELEILRSFDIGIMPLPDDEWSQGKCGLKMLTYLACGIPCVASHTKANEDILDKTKGGLLARNHQEWLNKLSELIENSSLRQTLGQNGRYGVEKHFSVHAWKDTFLHTIVH